MNPDELWWKYYDTLEALYEITRFPILQSVIAFLLGWFGLEIAFRVPSNRWGRFIARCVFVLLGLSAIYGTYWDHHKRQEADAWKELGVSLCNPRGYDNGSFYVVDDSIDLEFGGSMRGPLENVKVEVRVVGEEASPFKEPDKSWTVAFEKGGLEAWPSPEWTYRTTLGDANYEETVSAVPLEFDAVWNANRTNAISMSVHVTTMNAGTMRRMWNVVPVGVLNSNSLDGFVEKGLERSKIDPDWVANR